MIHRKKERRWCRWGNYIQQNKLQQQTKWYLVDYLSSEGERLEKSGREWRWLRHDSITIRGNQWYRHKEQRGGYSIEFVKCFYGVSFKEAMKRLHTFVHS